VDTQHKFQFTLFITGASPNSIRAVNNLKEIGKRYLNGNYELEIIDVYQVPELAEIEQIIALPTLIKRGPGPERRLVGDLSDRDKVLKGLGIDFRE
jgi:circadian clock protein KaiB